MEKFFIGNLLKTASLADKLKLQYAFRLTLVYILFNFLQTTYTYFFVSRGIFYAFLLFLGLTLLVPFVMKISRSLTVGASFFVVAQMSFIFYLQINLSCGYILPTTVLAITALFLYTFYVLGTHLGLLFMLVVALMNILGHFLRESGALEEVCDRTSVLFTEAQVAPFISIPNLILLALAITGFLRSSRLILEESTKTAGQLRAIIDFGLQNIVLLDKDGTVLLADKKSEALARILKKSKSLVGQKITDYLMPVQRDYFQELLKRAFQGEAIRTEIRLFLGDNRYSWVDTSLRPVLSHKDKVEYVVMATIETTKRREAEEQLKRTQNHLRAIIDNTSHLILSLDSNYRILEINDKLKKTLAQYSSKEISPGISVLEFIPEGQAGLAIKEHMSKTFQGKATSHIVQVTKWDGTPQKFEISYNPIYDEKRQVIGITIFAEDVTQREDYQSSLIAARQAAEEASKAKSEFLANMSHEMRTPLNAILGMTELLLESQLTKEQQQFATILQRAARNLTDLVNDLLDFSRIEAGKLEVKESVCDIRELVSQAIEIVAAAASVKQLSLVSEWGADVPPYVMLDNRLLRQILLNLIGNAVKFTPQGSITIRCEKVAQTYDLPKLRISVIDTGIGITEEQKRKLFTRFSPGDSSHTKAFSGTGLGLAICYRLVTMMGGTITVNSEVGKGSVFTVELPFREVKQIPSPLTSTPPTSSLTTSKSNKSLLLVEDNEDNLLLLETFLKPLNHTLVKASNGQQAVDLYKNGKFNAILMDLQMPFKDGFSAIREIREWEQQEGLPHTPIIALSAYAMQKEIQLAQEVGCDAYLTKPYQKKELLSLLEKFLT